jgi:folate-dependent phosphoribosylglycinamide formyltransferase PurN|tara:strand:+ start:1066 stop:1644 length:579 start_codon:yes stop_codon:yes gene_type:complete
MKKWIVLFSQTGSEVVDLALHFDRWPDIIVTSNSDVSKWHPQIRELHERGLSSFSGISRIKVVSNIEAKTANFFHGVANIDSFITLHGWLRIVPESICNMYTIYNGHPGLITEYPELKGKDPQERMFNNGSYTYYGSVVHKVVPEVDSGEIVSEVKRFNTMKTLDEVYTGLKSTSLSAWIDFLQTTDIIKRC